MTKPNNCPFCKAVLPATDAAVTVCPACQRALPARSPKITPGVDRTDQTVVDDSIAGEESPQAPPDSQRRLSETIESVGWQPGSDTAADSALGSTPPESSDTPKTAHDIDQTLFSEPQLPPSRAGAEPAEDEPSAAEPPSERRLDATLDSATITPFDQEGRPAAPSDATLDLDAANLRPPGTGSDTSDRGQHDVTLDSAELPAENDVARISALWSQNFGPEISTSTSLAVDSPKPRTKSRLVIQSRALKPFQDSGPRDAKLDYELGPVLGEGGMGIVHIARQASVDRTVALKKLKPESAQDEKLRAKFESEVAVTGDLEHPNIIPIYDMGSDEEGVLFYAMKRVKGTPWDQVIDERSQLENVEILMKVADAVGFAHSRRAIHRDLKPENVMLGDFGEVLVMDWGLAVTQENIATSGMGGTPAYMAPEMAAGPLEKIGPASDIYLLGAILYEIITKQRPHAGKDVMTCLMAAARNQIASTDKEGELLNIALRAMATRIEDRHATVGDFQTAIREFQAHSESIALCARADEDLKDAQTNDNYQSYARAAFGYEEAHELWNGNEKAAAGLIEARRAYAASALRKEDFDLGISLLDTDQPAHQPLLKQLKHARDERDARQSRLRAAKRIGFGLAALLFLVITVAFFWIRAKERYAVEQQQIAKRQEQIAREQEGFAREQEQLAKEQEKNAKEQEKIAKEQEKIATEQKTIAIAQKEIAETERQAAIAAQQKEKEARQREEYGAYIARIGLANAKIEENAFDNAREILEACPESLRHWEWSRLMHLCSQDTQSYDAKVRVEAVAFSPDAQRFVTAGWDDKLRVWDVEEGKVELTIPTGAQLVHAVAFSPRGTQIASGTNDPQGYVKIWDARTGQLLRRLDGHRDSVVSVQFSRDGKRLLTSSYDETARLWNIETGESVPFVGHDWWVWSARFSPDEKNIVTASQDGTAIVWSVDSPGKPGAPFRGHGMPVFAAAFSPDGQSVVSGGYDNRLLIWKPDEIKPFDITTLVTDKKTPPPPFRELLGHTAGVRSVSFSRDGKLVLSGSQDNTLRVWDVDALRPLKVIRGHASGVRSCMFSPDNQTILSGSFDKKAKLWSFSGYNEIRVFRGRVLSGHLDAVLSASFSPNGDRILTASRDRTGRIIPLSGKGESIELDEGHAFLASRAVFFPDGKRFLTGSFDDTARVWDVASGSELLELDGTGTSAAVTLSHNTRWILTGSSASYAKLWNAETGALIKTFGNHKAEITAVAFSPDDKFLLTGDAKGACRLWNRETGAEVWSQHIHSRAVSAAQFTPDGTRVLTASLDNSVGQTNIKDGKEDLKLLFRHPDAVTALAVSIDGRLALTACADRAVRLWDVATGQQIKELCRGEKAVNAVAFSSDALRALTTSADGAVRMWDIQTAQEIVPNDDAETESGFRTGHHLVWAAIFTPDDNYVLTVGGNYAKLWETKSGADIMTFSPHGSVASANFSADGKRVVTGSWDNSARIWNSETGIAIMKLEGHHKRPVNTAVFSLDGSMVLTASDDGTARLWNAETGKHIRAIEGHKGPVRSAMFSPDGSRIVTASSDRTARIWDAATGRQFMVLEGHEWPVLSAQFSHDGRHVVTASADNTALVFDVATGERRDFTLGGHTADVTSAHFSPDDLRIITGSEDNTAKIWDAKTGKEILTLKGHVRAVTSARFSPDGDAALTSSRDGTAILWPAAKSTAAVQDAAE